jgi:allose kinase
LFTIHRNDDLIKEFILNFAKAISLEMNIFDTPTIIIGGGVVNMTGFPKELLLKQIGEETREPSIKNNLNIMFVDDLPINGIIGANIVARRYL